jgi:cell division ATPase FtsA
MDEAWASMAGMVRGHPDLREFQDPVLLAVNWGTIYYAEGLSARKVHQHVSNEWAKWADGRLAVPGSLRVVLEVGVGVQKEVEEEVEEPRVGHAVGRIFKRMAEYQDGSDEGEEEDEEGQEESEKEKEKEKEKEDDTEGHRHKRYKKS